MARRSKETIRTEQNKNISNVYNAVGYIRLSNEDFRHSNNTNTLKDQELLVTDYIEKAEDLILCNVFSDNGASGTNFNRPGFKSMISAIKEKRYNCIVVKDLSRFGRNHLETAYYLYEFFPEHNIRFIAINDGYDSIVQNHTLEDIIMPIKNLINENYAREVSRKIGITKRLNAEKGLFLQNYTPYGYKKSQKEKGKLVADEKIVPIVQKIFDLYVNKNMTIDSISRKLNDEDIISPSKYKYEQGIAKCKKWENAAWSYGSVRNVLKNPVYTGCIVLGKHKQNLYKNETARFVPRSEWIIIPDSHEAIISTELFDLAQDKFISHKNK